jgi:hypothetical protein
MTPTLQLTRKWDSITDRGKRQVPIDAADEQVVRFSRHGQLLWPMYVASLIKPDLWISLRRE